MRCALLLVLLVGCVSHAAVGVGGTPGDPAVDCAANDRMCRNVVDSLETVRRNIGGWCGTSRIWAQQVLRDQGRAAVPYLARAFDDRDTEVAVVAMRTTVDLGDVDRVVDWCRGVHDLVRIDMCRRVLL